MWEEGEAFAQKGGMTCSWLLASHWVRSVRTLGPCLGPFPRKPCTDSTLWLFFSFSLAVPFSCRSMWLHVPLSVALLLEHECISQTELKLLPACQLKAFGPGLALDKTSIKVQIFFHLMFWSLILILVLLLFKIHFVLTCLIFGLSAWVFSCPLSQNMLYGALEICTFLLLFCHE